MLLRDLILVLLEYSALLVELGGQIRKPLGLGLDFDLFSAHDVPFSLDFPPLLLQNLRGFLEFLCLGVVVLHSGLHLVLSLVKLHQGHLQKLFLLRQLGLPL